MNTTDFHYTTFIRTTPEKVWEAIINPEFAKQYWGNANHSDWKPGSSWKHLTPGGETMIVGIVREVVPPTRLVISWAAPDESEDQTKHSQVTFEIEVIKDMVKLHVTHERLTVGSPMAQGVTAGWPRVLSSLKSFLETGEPLAISCH